MFSKTVRLKFHVRCDIHDVDIGIGFFSGPLPESNDPLVYGIDDGCSPENYVVERVGDD